MSSLALHRTHTFSSSAGKLHYLSYEPPGWEDAARPLVVFLHGAGERGSDVAKVASHGIPLEIERGKNFPFVAISPLCPSGQNWNELGGALTELLDEVVATFKIDERRVYLTGISMGGFGAWHLAATTPNRFAALVPIAGGGDPSTAEALRSLPTWAFHGDQDNVVPASKTQGMVDALTALGAPIKLTLYPGVGHDSWTQTYENPELYDWILGQRRGSTDASERMKSEHGPTTEP
jgi:predicted peptidase